MTAPLGTYASSRAGIQRRNRWLIAAACAAAVLTWVAARPVAPPPGAVVIHPANEQIAVFSGGCFWGVQAVFEHVRGVTGVTAGYAGGEANTAQYEVVSTGETGHAESVRITFDPARVSYADLLKVFFTVAHDPTTLNRQGPDEGTQYRSAIWYTSDDQKRVADSVIQQLTTSHVYKSPIVTQVASLKGFYPAEAYHQDYFVTHPYSPYIVINDKPKVAALRRDLPNYYQEAPVLYVAKN